MPSEVYSILVKAGYKGTEQDMFRTFAFYGVTPASVAKWTLIYNIISAANNAGDVLTSNGAGTDPTWQAPTSGGPGGNDTEVQFNDAETFAGDSTFKFNKITKVVDISKLKLAAGTTELPPIQFTSGDLLDAELPGAVEFQMDDLYLGLSTGAGTSYISQYPPLHNDTYVKATSILSSVFYPYCATNPANSLVGNYGYGNTWLASTYTNQRFHIDLFSAKIINGIYYENVHTNGTNTMYGSKNFTLWGSNSATDFNDLTYDNDGTWTQITGLSQSYFDQHVGLDIADPKYITFGNTTAYRYYALKIADNWSGNGYVGLRRIELQTGSVLYPRCPIVLADEDKLTATKIPLASTNGRLIDSGITQAAGLTTIDRNTKVSGSVQVANNSDAAGVSNVGAIRYRTSGNNSYCEMCMQTGASTYAWIVINTQSW